MQALTNYFNTPQFIIIIIIIFFFAQELDFFVKIVLDIINSRKTTTIRVAWTTKLFRLSSPVAKQPSSTSFMHGWIHRHSIFHIYQVEWKGILSCPQ